MGDVVFFERFKRRKLGLRPSLGLLGLRSTSDTVLRAALAAVEPRERGALCARLCAGTYADMLAILVEVFEIEEASRAFG